MITEISQTHANFAPANCKPFVKGVDYSMDEVEPMMKAIGIGFNAGVLRKMAVNSSAAMDTIQAAITTPAIPNVVQFLQEWLPGFVSTITAARKIDNLIGKSTIGSWEDEQIVQQILEPSGAPVPYGDLNVVPVSDWNLNFVTRTVVRMELGLRVGQLEQTRSARLRIDSAAQKRAAAAVNLEITRNLMGFFGYNSGANLTYGFLNDPNLPNYVSAVTGNWATATFLQIQTDILTAIQALRTNSQDVIDVGTTPITLAIATSKRDYLSKTSDFGISVMDWLKSTYPNVRVESAPQLNTANSGAAVFYLYADQVNDGLSTDDLRTFIQIVPATFQFLGTAQMTKGFEEDYSNASAGTLCKRPYAVVRVTGI